MVPPFSLLLHSLHKVRRVLLEVGPELTHGWQAASNVGIGLCLLDIHRVQRLQRVIASSTSSVTIRRPGSRQWKDWAATYDITSSHDFGPGSRDMPTTFCL